MKRVHFLVSLIILLDLELFMKCQEIDFGDWLTEDGSRLAQPGPCNIEVVNVKEKDFTNKMFLENFAYTKPLVIKQATNNKEIQDKCMKSTLLKIYGDKIIRLSTANTHSYKKRDVSFEHYVTELMQPQTLEALGNETFYWFGDNNHTEWAELFDTYVPPPYHLPGLTEIYSFGAAAAGTGVPFHFHGATFGETIFGRKRWFLYPPEKRPAFNENQTTLHWLFDEYDNLHPLDKPLECTLGPGEIIYFPDRWWHGTLNIDTSVFISTFLG